MAETLDIVRTARILIVDDEEINQALISAILRGAGFKMLVCASSGVEALEHLEQAVFDCVVMDVVMPGLDGLEVCRRIRAHPRTQFIPVLIQTAQTGRSDMWAAFDAGASDVVHKPLDPREIVSRVKNHASNAMMARFLREDRDRFLAESQEAAALMEMILPRAEQLGKLAEGGYLLDWFIQPSQTIGGDLWAAWPISDHQSGLFFADVSGHGVAAALRAFALYSLFMPPPPFSDDPLRMAAHLDQRLHQLGGQSFQFVATFYGVHDRRTGELAYVAGGLRDGHVFHADGGRSDLKLSGLPFGIASEVPRQVRRLTLQPDDFLLLYSDALVEDFGPDGQGIEESRLIPWLEQRLAGKRLQTGLAQGLAEDFLAESPFCQDDLLLVLARFPSPCRSSDP